MTQPLLSGLVAALITPMSEDGGAARPEALGQLVKGLIRAGVEGFFVCGSTGESPLLADDERVALARAAVEAARGRAAVVAQATVDTTERTIRLARALAAEGLQGIALLAPGYYRFREDEIAQFFVEVARSIPGVPVYLYNIPQRTGNVISPALAERVARQAPNVAGIKDSSGSMQQLLGLLAVRNRLQEAGREFRVLSGDDGLAMPALWAGADGLVSGNSSVLPEPFVELLRAYRRGDLTQGRELALFINELAAVLGNGTRLDLFKTVASRRGVPSGSVRRPGLPGSEAEACEVWARVQALYAQRGWRLDPLA